MHQKTAAQNRERRQESLQTLRECFDKSSIAIFTDYRGEAAGLTVKEMTDLRGKLRDQKAEFRVAKNTMIRRTLHDLGIQEVDPHLQGPTAVAFGYEDPAATAKAVLDFSKERKPNRLPQVKVAIMDGHVIDTQALEAIASLPSLEVLRMQLLGLMLAPHRQLLGMLKAPGRSMATVLDAWNTKRQEG
ncbi:MAG: 50S ribosomal protein L10 [Candidatus Xenobium sp.]|jgi:large subunit ribosomal protein L10|nr:50S ribosomal protein L10 [Burkholderiales bacterium]